MSDVNHAAILDSIDPDADPTVYVAENGSKFKLQRVSNIIISDAAKKLKAPRPPEVYIEEKGRSEENPSDPDYLEEVSNYDYDRAMLALNVYLSLGTKVLELGPGVESVDSTDWSDTLGEIGLTIPATGRGRYVAWIKYIALGDDEKQEIMQRIMSLSGATLQAEVREAEASFPSDPPRLAIAGVRSTA